MITPEEHDQVATTLENIAAALRKDGAVFAGDNLSPKLANTVASEIDTLVTLHRVKALDALGPAEKREALALRRNDAFVNSTRVICAYDRCGARLSRTGGPEHAWKAALRTGWKLVTPSDPHSTDLCCPDEHDEYGRNKNDL
jgi:hypothetical protein